MSRLGVALRLSAVLFLVLLIPSPLLAQDLGDPPLVGPQPIVTVLTKLAQSVGVGVVISFLFKSPGWFKGLSDNAKWRIIFGLSIALPVLAQLLIDLIPPNVWTILNPYWTSLAWGFVAWTASQASFEQFIKPNRASDGA